MSNLTEKPRDNVKKSHITTQNEPKSEKATQDVQKNCLSLTEQWKKGELKDGCYYVKLKRPDMFYMLSREDNHWYEFGWDCWFFDDDIAEILAPIPSYEEWEQLQNWADFTSDYHELREKIEIAEYKNAELENKMNLERQLYKYVLEENAKLKELLKDARNVLKMVDTYCGDNDSINEFLIVKRIDEVLK